MMRCACFLFFAMLAVVSAPLQAQTFAPINQLFFTKSFGGANPLPQVLEIASTTTNFNYSVSSTTNSGGAWFSTTPSGNCCTTPNSVRAAVNATALAVGTYTGQITFGGGVGGNMVVPVTLIVAPLGGTYFDNMPGGLSFTAKTGGASFASHSSKYSPQYGRSSSSGVAQ